MLQFDSVGGCVRCLLDDVGAVAVFCSDGHNIFELQKMGRTTLEVGFRAI